MKNKNSPLGDGGKTFFFKDKSGRGFTGTFTDKEIKGWDADEDWDGKTLKEYIREAEKGDEFENASTYLICTQSN